MRLLVVVPTTGGPLVLRSLRLRAGLPASAAFGEGDYRPLPWSADYARLSGPEGPISAALGGPIGAFELRLSRSFDTGRSWEAPVALAHLRAAAGDTIVGQAAEADLMVWATGAVDLDLRPIGGDYALLDKLERSRDLLGEAAGARLPIAFLLPPGPGRDGAAAFVAEVGRTQPAILLPADDLVGASASLPAGIGQAAAPPTAEAPASRPPPWRAGALGVAAILIGAGIAAAAWWTSRDDPHPRPPIAEEDARQASSSPSPSRTEVPASLEAPPDSFLKGSGQATEPPPLSLEELHAPPRFSCRQVVFGAAAPERRAVGFDRIAGFAPSKLAPSLCGIAFKPHDRDRFVLQVGRGLTEAALPPTAGPDGAQVYLLRDNPPQKIVYAIQARDRRDGAGHPAASFAHALER